MKRYILSLSFAALCCVSLQAQDIILLNQDGEKVGVAKDIDDKKAVDNEIIKVEVKTDGEKGSAKIENGVVTVVGPDGEVSTFKLSDAKSVSINQSSKTVVGEDGKPRMEVRGKAILIGPDGVRREIDLKEGGGNVSTTTASKTWMIGVSCKPASPVLRSQLQLDEGIGLVIHRVLQGGAGEKAGLKENDILVFADQTPVGDRKQLSEVVNAAGAAGNEVSFTVLRGGEEVSVSVLPTEREGMSQMMIELGPGMGGFDMDFPGFGDGADFEFKQFGPGIIIGGEGGVADLHAELMGDFDEKIERIREEMEEMRRRMREGK